MLVPRITEDAFFSVVGNFNLFALDLNFTHEDDIF